jgi:hypothetical protein
LLRNAGGTAAIDPKSTHDDAMANAEQINIRSERTMTSAAAEPAALDPKWTSEG